ncbi:MAG: hypothetical protein ACYSR4_00125 [Planctomycetota bacterium]|jgi:hypothetical protein
MIRRAAIAALLVALSAGPAQAEGGLCGCDVVRNGLIDSADFAMFALYWGSDACWSGNDWCYGADFDQDGFVDGVDLDIITDCWLLEDTTAPTPDAMQWDPNVDESGYDGRPLGVGSGPFDYYATMRAEPNTFDETGFEFFFECSHSGYNSGWISFPEGPPYVYTVKVGSWGQVFTFRVRARDTSVNQDENVTDWSSEVGIRWPPP